MTTLNLEGNYLSDLPSQLTSLKRLTYLNLAGNTFASLPNELLAIQSLEKLNLNSSRLANLEHIEQLPQLQQVQLAYNQIKELPQGIGQLSELKLLDLGHNRIKKLPDGPERRKLIFQADTEERAMARKKTDYCIQEQEIHESYQLLLKVNTPIY